MFPLVALLAVAGVAAPPADEDGSRLWLRYPRVASSERLAEYEAAFYPREADWRRNVLEQSRDFLARGIAGVGAS